MIKNIVPLSDHTKQIILGSLLGDGSLEIQKGCKNARFSFNHSKCQKEYFYWKVDNLKEISAQNSIFEQNAGGFSKMYKLRFQSRALESLTELYKLTHKRREFVIRRKWLNQMSALSLAIWWFDVGSLITNSRRGVFCTDRFSKTSVQKLARYLQIVWGIRTHVAPIRRIRNCSIKQYWRLWIRSSEELQKFLHIILPYVPVEEMIPKVLLLYKDSQRQQRWISEVMQATKVPREVIERYVREKKSKLKHFRE